MKAFINSLMFALALQGFINNKAANAQSFKDIEYALIDSVSLKLDIYLPQNHKAPFPVVVWIHGGAFKSGSKEFTRCMFLLEKGIALVSINYRLSGQAKFPAQIHDCKAVVRWLRANGVRYNLNTGKIGVIGSSAGGHLASMLGTTSGNEALEGEVGGNLYFTSEVQAVCSLWGPSNFITLMDQKSSLDHESQNSPEGLLIGGSVRENQEKAWYASPIKYISEKTPPFLIIHGLKDLVIPAEQSTELFNELKNKGIDVKLHLIEDMEHGGPLFETEEVRKMISDFFIQELMQKLNY